MRITVNLDTQSVITQPSPLRFKAGCFNSIEIGFTRSSQSVPLPDGSVIEFALKPRNQWTGGLLAYLNVFSPAAGNLYAGTLNCATAGLLSALGLSDQLTGNDVAQIDASAEVTWSFGGQKFRSTTFSVTVEAPVTDDNAAASPDPELYPTPAEVARKSDLPIVATTAEAATGTRADLMMSPLGVAQWFAAKLPGVPSNALLGDGSWGLPDLSSYAGSLAGDGTNVTGVSGVQLNSPFGNQFYDDNAGSWVSSATLQAPGFSGPYGGNFCDANGSWNFNNGIVAPNFNGDGSSLSNVAAIQLSGPYGSSIYDTGGGNWQIDGGINTGWINASFNGDGTNIYNVTAYQINSPYGYPIYDAGWGNWQVNGGISAGGFSGDGSGLYNVNASQLNSPYGYSIYDSGWGNWQVNGWIYGSFGGDGSQLYNIGFAQNAYADEYGNEIAYAYVQQWG